MKKALILISLAVGLWGQAQSSEGNSEAKFSNTQEKTYRLKKNSGKLLVNIGRVVIEGYSGNEIIFSLSKGVKKEDDRAVGLRAVNSLGLDDNTGLGINVEDKNGTVTVNQLKRMEQPEVRIQVPKNMTISFSHQSQFGGKAVFRNIESEIEISSQYNNILLDNVTGPAIVKSIYGNIDAVFGDKVKGPLSLLSIYGHVDVTLPKSIKTDLQAATSYGDIFVSPDFKIELEPAKENSLVKYDDLLKGKLNGGGLSVKLSADYGKIYLRAK